jgi:hypothetical protein
MSGKGVAEIDLSATDADAATVGDRYGSIVKGILEICQAFRAVVRGSRALPGISC